MDVCAEIGAIVAILVVIRLFFVLKWTGMECGFYAAGKKRITVAAMLCLFLIIQSVILSRRH